MADDLARLRLPLLVRQNVDAFVAGLRHQFGPRLRMLRLFGSYARGDAHEDSDVDCLVLLDHVTPEDDRAVTDLAGDLTWQIGGAVISPLVMSEAAFGEWRRRGAAHTLRDRARGRQSVTKENRRANSTAEIARADESLRAARVLTDAGLLADAESRVYYAAFHAAVALLLAEGLEARSHSGVAQLLGPHFVKPGRLDPGDARLLATAEVPHRG